MGSRWKACALVAGALLFASPAVAAPSRADRENARKLMDEGSSRMKAGDPLRAVESFQKANDIMHVPTTGIALANAQLAAGHLVEAREAALDVARTQPDPDEPPVFRKARKRARDLEAQLKPRIPTIKIHVRGGTASSIAVDGDDVPVELASEAVPVNPGKRIVTAKASDGSTGKADVDIQESEKKDVDVVLVPKSGGDPKPVVASKDTKDVSSSSSSSPTSSDPPKRVLGFGNEDVGSRGQGRTPLAEGLLYGGFATAGVGLLVGSITGAMTLSKASAVSPQCERNICDPAAKSDLSSANTLATVSTIGFGLGIAGLGVGFIGLFMPKQGANGANGKEKQSSLAVHPTTNGLGGTF